MESRCSPILITGGIGDAEPVEVSKRTNSLDAIVTCDTYGMDPEGKDHIAIDAFDFLSVRMI